MSLRIKYNNTVSTPHYFTLNDRFPGQIITAMDFAILFTRKTDSVTHTALAIDYSDYPEVYNKLYIATSTGTTGLNNVQLDQGWYKYEVYTWEDRILKVNLLEAGQCYVYDNDERAGNVPDNTETYQDDKTKYVYTKK